VRVWVALPHETEQKACTAFTALVRYQNKISQIFLDISYLLNKYKNGNKHY
jgi:hypothetical protein